MNRRKLILIAAVMTLPMLTHAKEKISIQAKGLVCGLCAQGIEKNFKAVPGVENIKVSFETKKIDLDLKDGTSLSDDDIGKIITKSGFVLVKIERSK